MREGWEYKKLGEVCKVERGSSPRPIRNFITEDENGVHWVKIGDVGENDKYVTKTKQKITKIGAQKSRFVDVGDFILSNSMSFGRPYIMKIQGYIHDGWFVLRLPENLDSDYFWYLLSSPLLSQQFQELAAGAIVKNISGDLVKKAKVPIPTLPEQKQIVKILDKAFTAIDQARANIEKNIASAEELFQSKLNAVFSQTGEGWEEKRFGDIAEYDKTKNYNNNLPYVGLENIKSNTGILVNLDIEKKVKSSTFNFNQNHVLYGRLRPYLNKVLVPEFEGHCSTEIFPIFPKKELSRNFLFYWLMSPSIVKKINETWTGARMPRANMKEVLDFTLLIPSVKIQISLVGNLNEIKKQNERIKKTYRSKLVALENLKKSILQKAFAGELTSDYVVEEEVLNVAAEPEVEYNKEIAHVEIHAGIISYAFNLHRKAGKENTFGHVKMEKISHLAEAFAGIALGRNPYKDAAGPNDFNHLINVLEPHAKEKNYFVTKKRPTGGYDFFPKKNLNTIARASMAHISEEQKIALDKIITLIIPMRTRGAELVATVFAAWNNLLILGKPISDEAIVYEARENWHPKKMKIKRPLFFNTLALLKKENIIPSGSGKLVDKNTLF